jgi:hypothetical protein
MTQFCGARYARPHARNLHNARGLVNPIGLGQNQTSKGYESAPDMKPDRKGGIKLGLVTKLMVLPIQFQTKSLKPLSTH